MDKGLCLLIHIALQMAWNGNLCGQPWIGFQGAKLLPDGQHAGSHGQCIVLFIILGGTRADFGRRALDGNGDNRGGL